MAFKVISHFPFVYHHYSLFDWSRYITMLLKSYKTRAVSYDSQSSHLLSFGIMVNYFRCLLEDEEIIGFQPLLGKIVDKIPYQNQDSRVWSLNGSWKFTVKSLTHHLSPSSPLYRSLYKAIWKSDSPRRVNILFWI